MNQPYTLIQDYITQFVAREPDLLQALRKETDVLPGSHMIAGVLQGRLLSIIAQMVKPQNILEIGTYTGYSALCLLEGLQPKGNLYTIDKDPKSTHIAKQYFQKSGMQEHIHLYIDDAISVLQKIKNPLDLVFIDADKKNIAIYYDLVFDQVTQGGVILVDNVLWKGQVLAKQKDVDIYTKCIQQFTKKVHADIRVSPLILPIRDGLMIILKK